MNNNNIPLFIIVHLNIVREKLSLAARNLFIILNILSFHLLGRFPQLFHRFLWFVSFCHTYFSTPKPTSEHYNLLYEQPGDVPLGC